jgi:threonine dehydrogenase-like Zn-dependent dehydrogenase
MSMNDFRVIEFVGNGVARAAVREAPAAPLGRDEVEGTTLVTLASPGTELAYYTRDLSQPAVFGYAAVFRIDRVGDDVSGLRPGQVVFGMGPHAGFQRMPATEVTPLPDGLAPEVAVFARLMAVSWTTLVTTRARPADRVLILGLGIVGNLAAQNFAAAGYRVTAVDPVARRRELAEHAGISRVLAEAPPAERGSDGFHLVVDCSGHEDAVLAGCRTARHGAEVVLVGVPWQRRSDATAHDVFDVVFHRFLEVRSGWEWRLPAARQMTSPGSIADSIEGALHWLAEGRVDATGLAVTTDPADAGAAYAGLAAGDGRHLTVLFDWAGWSAVDGGEGASR